MKTINILGTKYRIFRVKSGQDEYMDKMHFGGYCDEVGKRIVLLELKTVPEWADESEERIAEQEKETMRHELIHAFLNESGLSWNSFTPDRAWAKNEEMVDWFAIQMPKIYAAFKAADCL